MKINIKIKLCNKTLDVNTQPCVNYFMNKNFTSQGQYRFITFYVTITNKKKIYIFKKLFNSISIYRKIIKIFKKF